MSGASHSSSPQGLPAHSAAAPIVVSIVVPTYCEADNLPLLVPQVTTALQPWSHEIIIVDDNSNDRTDQVVESLRQQGHLVRLIIRTNQRGLSSAVLRGFFEAKGNVLICIDADLSHPPDILPRMIETLEGGQADLVIGSRYVASGGTDEQWSLFRKLNSRVATLMARPFCRAKDPLAGYFALPRAVFERAHSLDPIGYKIGLELIVKCGCTRIIELPIHFRDRCLGQSKLTIREQINYVRHLKRLSDFKFGVWSQIAQFCLVGTTGMIVDLLSYALLLQTGVALPLARALAIFVAIGWNFILNRRLSFSRSRFGRSVGGQYVRWLASTAVGAIVSWSVAVGMPLLMNFFARHVFIAAMIGIVAGSVTNFMLARHWVFTSAVGEDRP